MRHRWMIPALVVLAAHAAPGGGAAQVTIGPTFESSRPPAGERAPFFTMGQTFTVPTEASFLSAFSLGVAEWYNGAAPIFRLFVMDWSESAFAPVGDVLFRSAAQTGVVAGEGSQGSKRYEFSPGVSLSPGGTYIAFLSMHEDPQPPPECRTGFHCEPGNRNAIMGLYYDVDSGPGTPYEGGMLVLATDFTSGTPREWRPVRLFSRDGADANFRATFVPTSTVPEPASMALLGTGLAGLAGVASRRRRKQEVAQG